MRVYGKVVDRWTADYGGRNITVQFEVAYTDYDADWNVIGVGTEDFSPERYYGEVSEKWVSTWDGSRRNKGGHRWFEDRGLWKFRKSDAKAFKAAVAKRFGAAEVTMKKW